MKKKRVAVVKSEVESVLKCADYLKESVEFVLIGDIGKNRQIASSLNISLSDMELIHIEDEKEAGNYAADMAVKGDIDIVMKGLIPTRQFLLPLLKRDRGLLSDRGNIISLISKFELPDYHKPLFITDCGINMYPDLEQKKSILLNAVNVAEEYGIKKPKVACITPVEFINPKMQSTLDAAKLKQMDFGNAIVEGPISLDLALSAKAAGVKEYNSPVAGDADILLFHNIDQGNVAYKALSLFGHPVISGIAAGFRLPVILTSRADSFQTKLESLKFALNLG